MEEPELRLGPARARVLAVLRDADRPLSIIEVGERLGVHPNSVRFHLDALVAARLVGATQERRPTPGRPRMLYTAEATVDRAYSYELLSRMLVGVVEEGADDAAATAERVGRAWSWLLPEAGRQPDDADEILGAMIAGLDRVGFTSQVAGDEDGLRLEVRRCPFLKVVRGHEEVVCSLHLGLMRGLLEGMDAPLGVRDLQPLVEPDLCLAHLTSAHLTPA